jgi:hypothetical protein
MQMFGQVKTEEDQAAWEKKVRTNLGACRLCI